MGPSNFQEARLKDLEPKTTLATNLWLAVGVREKMKDHVARILISPL